MTRRIVTVILLIIGLCSYTQAATFYVSSSTGNDSFQGTATNLAWKTLQKVNTQMNTFHPGDKILFRCGDTWTSVNSTAPSGSNPMIKLDQYGAFNGSQTGQITFSFYPNSGTTCTSIPKLDGNGTNTYGFFFNQAAGTTSTSLSYITIDSFEIVNVTLEAILLHNFTPGGTLGMPGVIISNNITHADGPGAFTGATQGPTSPSNNACSNTPPGGPAPCSQTYYNTIMFLDEAFAVDNTQILSNQSYDNGGWNLIELQGDHGSAVVQGNTVHGWVHNGLDIKEEGLINGNPGTVVKNNMCYQDLTWGGACYYYENATNTSTGGATWIGNYAWSAPNGIQCEGGSSFGSVCQAYNNTLYMTGTTSAIVSCQPSVTCPGTGSLQPLWDVRNNILDSSAPLFVCDSAQTNACSDIVQWNYNDDGGHTAGCPVISTLPGMSSFGTRDFNNVDPLYLSIVMNIFSLSSNPTLSPLYNAGDPSLFSITDNSNIGADATTRSTPSPTPTATPTPTSTPSSTPTPSASPTVSVNATFKNFHAYGDVGIQPLTSNGNYVRDVSINHEINPKAYGAKCDATCNSFGAPTSCSGTDDSTAFTTAMAAANQFKWVLKIPAATCIVNSTLNLTSSGVKIDGYGDKISRIVSTNTNQPMISVSSAATNWQISNLQLTRTATAVSGGDGIDVADGMAGPVIDHVFITRQYIGFNLQGASYGRLTKLQTFQDISDGMLMTAHGAQPLQWTIDDVLSELNGGSGFHAVNASSGLTNLAPWRQSYTYNNGGWGIWIQGGGSANGIYDGQISDWTSSADCKGGIMLDSYGKNWNISGGYDEFGGASGLTVSCSPSGQGNGINISPNFNGRSTIENNQLIQNIGSGILDQTADIIAYSNNFITLNQNHGIIILTNNAGKTITGGFSNSNTGFGLNVQGGVVYATGLVCANNSSGPSFGGATVLNKIGGNC